MKLYLPFKLDCQDQLKNYCYSYLEKNWNYRSEKIFRIDIREPIVQLLDQELKSKGLPPAITVSIFARGPKNKQSIHIDTAGEGWTIWKTGIYIPLLGLKGSKLKWFDPSKGTLNKMTTLSHVNSNGEPTKRLTVSYEGKLPVLDSVEFLDSHIINTVVPHRAEASDSDPRAALTIRLQTNPDLISLFSPDGPEDSVGPVPTIDF